MTDAFLAVMGAATRIQVMTRHSPVVAETRTAVEAANTEGHLRRARLREAGVRLAKPNAPARAGRETGVLFQQVWQRKRTSRSRSRSWTRRAARRRLGPPK